MKESKIKDLKCKDLVIYGNFFGNWECLVFKKGKNYIKLKNVANNAIFTIFDIDLKYSTLVKS